MRRAKPTGITLPPDYRLHDINISWGAGVIAGIFGGEDMKTLRSIANHADQAYECRDQMIRGMQDGVRLDIREEEA